MQNVHERCTAGDWQNLDCVQLWQLIQRMRSVRVGDIKLAQALADLSQDDFSETILVAQIAVDKKSFSIRSPCNIASEDAEMRATSTNIFEERKAIMTAALKLFSRTDCHISRRQLAREAGVATTKLTKHFRSLPELRAELRRERIHLEMKVSAQDNWVENVIEHAALPQVPNDELV